MTKSNDTNGDNATTLYAHTLTELPSPQVFYETYVKKRRPVLLKNCCNQVAPKLLQVATASSLDQLLDIVGSDSLVEVNQRNDTTITTKDVFSPRHSRVVTMKFGDFVEKLKSGSTDHYMTTQTLPTNEEGQPLLYTTPVTQLVDKNIIDTLRPPLLGNLIPMTYNLWIGQVSSTSSSSSGLHHDFHDNLYSLLEGSKEFCIAPPSSVHLLKMSGTLHTLHDNGRIVYQQQVLSGKDDDMIRPDGALVQVERIRQLEDSKEAIEQELQATTSKDINKQRLEDELNAIEEELLDMEMMNDGQQHAINDKGEEAVFGANYNDDDSVSDEDEPNPKRARMNSEQDAEQSDDDIPLNFVVGKSDAVQFQTVHMSKGDLLYLPAGWFHQVMSKGAHNDKSGLHIAFNYWMHPPDVGNDVTFEQPYESKFWQRDWESRQESK